ncbi:MAG: DUF4405 domain-containing protein [Nitrospirota bacterium]
MKNRGTINLIIDLFMVLALAFIAGIGFLIKYVLLPGREQVTAYGENGTLLFLGLDRHAWGTIHLAGAYGFIALVVIHIILHRKIIVSLIQRAVPSLLYQWILTAGCAGLAAVFLLFPFLIQPEQKERDYLFRNIGDPLQRIEDTPQGKNQGKSGTVKLGRGNRLNTDREK